MRISDWSSDVCSSDLVAARDVVPRILAQLLEAEADAVALLVVLEHAHVELLADFNDFGRMAHALPGHVGDVQQAVDAAQVHERAVVGEVLDHALEHGALDQLLEQLLALFRMLALDHRAARNHHVVALAVELDELELQLLAFQVHRVADRAHVDQGTGQERTDVLDVDGETRSEEHTSELQSLMRIQYAVFCLKKNKNTHMKHIIES